MAGNGLLISMLEKLDLFLLIGRITLGRKINGTILEENHLLRCWDYLSLLNWIGDSYSVSTAKITSKKIGASLDLFYEVSF